MEIIYAGKAYALEEGKNGFDAAKLVDPEKKNKDWKF